MLGKHPGWVTTQGEVLAKRFAQDGWSVRATSQFTNRLLRLVDTVSCLVRWRRTIDVVQLSVFSGPAFVLADVTSWLTRMLRIPTILVLRGGNLPDFERRHKVWVRRVLRRGALITAPSSFLAQQAGRGFDVMVIPNLVDLEDLPFQVRADPAARLLWMRTFHVVYNPSMAIEALSLLRKRLPDASLTMAGQDKGLEADNRERVRREGLGDVVDFPGFLDPAGKAEAFGAHDIYLHTNHIDNTPVSVLEAAAAGLPIVATDVGGIAHLLEHERTALLVPDGDAQAMAEAVDRILTEPGLAESLSLNARSMAERSSWPAVSRQWEHAFHRVLRGD